MLNCHASDIPLLEMTECISRKGVPMKDKTILVVEDTPMNMELVADILKLNDYHVLQAETAEKGIQMARNQHPDLILMDISLPGIDGLKATRIIKEDPLTQDVPVVALTAHAMEGDHEKALSAGCCGVITKPIDTRCFIKMVDDFLTKRG